MSVVTIHNIDRPGRFASSSYSVFESGKRIGGVAAGESLSVNLPVGSHEIFIKAGSMRSHSFTVEVDGKSAVELECGVNQKANRRGLGLVPLLFVPIIGEIFIWWYTIFYRELFFLQMKKA